MTVAVRPAGPGDRPLIEGLMQLYIHDFSELEPAASDRFELNGEGRFDPYPLDPYWADEGFWPLIIEVGGKPAGFALINALSHRAGDNDRNMGEFFVARKFRKGGVGTEAVRRILALHPGRWEIAIADRNEAAKRFWPRAIEGAGVCDLACQAGDGARWAGPIWVFRTF